MLKVEKKVVEDNANLGKNTGVSLEELSKIGENQIEVKYSSDTAKKEFETIQIDFFSRFKHKVNNFQIEIIYREDITLKKGNLSKKQIFEQLMEINPVLKELENLMRFDFN